MKDSPGGTGAMDSTVSGRLAEAQRRLADLKARLPAHSVPRSMMVEMEALEEELARLEAEVQG